MKTAVYEKGEKDKVGIGKKGLKALSAAYMKLGEIVIAGYAAGFGYTAITSENFETQAIGYGAASVAAAYSSHIVLKNIPKVKNFVNKLASKKCLKYPTNLAGLGFNGVFAATGVSEIINRNYDDGAIILALATAGGIYGFKQLDLDKIKNVKNLFKKSKKKNPQTTIYYHREFSDRDISKLTDETQNNEIPIETKKDEIYKTDLTNNPIKKSTETQHNEIPVVSLSEVRVGTRYRNDRTGNMVRLGRMKALEKEGLIKLVK